eukprot:Skav226548  [mRNA]  locus=scaffold421:174894:175820:+ [translate_table: standard]
MKDKCNISDVCISSECPAARCGLASYIPCDFIVRITCPASQQPLDQRSNFCVAMGHSTGYSSAGSIACRKPSTKRLRKIQDCLVAPALPVFDWFISRISVVTSPKGKKPKEVLGRIMSMTL